MMRPNPSSRERHPATPHLQRRAPIAVLLAAFAVVGIWLVPSALSARGVPEAGPAVTGADGGVGQQVGIGSEHASPDGIAGTDAELPLEIESFEVLGAVTADWNPSGNWDVLQANDLDRLAVGDGNDPAATDGDRFLLLCTGPGQVSQIDMSSIDGDADNNSENDRASINQAFTLAPSQVPATLSFDWNFVTSESDGSVIPDPYDDIFQVTLQPGQPPILAGSVPGGGPSPYPDTPVDGVEIEVVNGARTDGCNFEWGQSGFKKFQMLITEPGDYDLQFLVADQGTSDFFIDSGLMIDNIRIEPEVDMVVSKRATPNPAVAGEAIFYELTVQNLGSGRATAVVVTDTLPADVRFVSADAPPTDDGMGGVVVDPACAETAPGSGVVECALGTFTGGESKVFRIQGEVLPDAVARGVETLTNGAVVDSFQIDADEANNTTEQVTFLDDLADLAIWKVSKPDDTVRAGERFTYTILVENLGPSHARRVVLSDTLLATGVFDLVDIFDDPARANDACEVLAAPAPQSGQIISCDLGEPLEPVGSGMGTGRWTIQVEATAREAQDVNNEVRVFTVDDPSTGTPGTPDPDRSNNVAVDRISILDTSDLVITKVGEGRVHDPDDCATITTIADRVTAGDVLTWTLVVTNQVPVDVGDPGGSAADNVLVEDTLPAGVELIDASPSAGNCTPGTPGVPSDPVRCSLGRLVPGQSASVTISVRVDDDYVGRSGTNLLANGARASSDSIDPDLSDNLASHVTRVYEVADLAVVKTASAGQVNAGTLLSWEIVITNSGPSTARNVIVRDRLPPEVEFRSARIEQLRDREQCTYSEGAHEVICSLFDVPPGEPPVGQRRVFINALVSPDTMSPTAVNTVTVESEQTPDCDVANNESTTVTDLGMAADLAIEKSSEPTKVFAGEQKRYDITVRNLGPSFAKDVVVYDVLPDEVEYEIDTNDPMCTSPANLVALRAVLVGDNEVPPVATSAMGLSTFVLDTDTNTLVYAVQLNDIDGIDGSPGVHIHRGAAGVNGPVEVFLFDASPPPIGPASPIVGEVVIAPALAAEIAADPAGFYVNVHSTDAPGGEVRGQLARAGNAPLRCELGTIENVPPAGKWRDPDDDTGSRSFSIWARVRPETPSGTTITNVAIVTSPTEPDRDPPLPDGGDIYELGSNNVDASKNLVLGKSDLKVTKFGKNDGEVRAGELLTYTVIVDNLGPSFAQDVSLKDILQSGATFDLIDISVSRDASCTTLAGGITNTVQIDGTLWPPDLAPAPPFGVLAPTGIEGIEQRLEVDCTLIEGDDPATSQNEAQLAVLTADGPPNSGRWILTMRVRARQAQDINNIADVVTTYEEPDPANNHAEVAHEITDVADLSVVKTARGETQIAGQPGLLYDTTNPAPAFPQAPNYMASGSQVTAGRRISYTIQVMNAGPSDAENVLLTDRLPGGVTLIPGTLEVTVDGRGTLPDGACQTGTPGEPLDRLQCGLGTLLGVEVGRDLSVRRAATVTFQVLVDPSVPPNAVLENDAFVTSDVFDPDNRDNHAHAQLAVTTAGDLATAKSSVGRNVVSWDTTTQRFVLDDVPGEVTAGLSLRYEITVQNAGPSVSRNVTISDTLPAGVRLVRVDGATCRPDTLNQNLIYCSVGDLAPGARRTFDVYVSVDHAIPEGTVLENCAEALFAPASPPAAPGGLPGAAPTLPLTDDPLAVDNTACTETTVRAVADVGGPGGGVNDFPGEVAIVKRDVPASPELDRTFEPDRALAGRLHRYRIGFGNAGPSTAVGVVLTDTLDFKQPGVPGETFVRCEPLDPDDLVTCSYDPIANVVTVEEYLDHNEAIISGGVGTLTPGLPYGFDLVVMVDPGYVLDADNVAPATGFNSEAGAIARNTALISTATTDFRTANDRDTERTRIVAEADLVLTKSDLLVDGMAGPDSAFLECDPVVPGGMITWTSVITNAGPSDAADSYLVDWLPEALVAVDPEQVTVDVSAGEVIEVRDDGRITVRLGEGENNLGVPELGRINVGGRVTVTIGAMVRLDAPCGAVATNRARVETRRNDAMWPPVVVGPPQKPSIEDPAGSPPTEPRTPTLDPDLESNETSERTMIECPAIEVDKTISFDGDCPGTDVPVINQTGQEVTFCYEITNTGTTYLDDIRVTDTLRTRTLGETIIFTDTITFGTDAKVPVAPGETVRRQVTVPSVTKECGIADDVVEVTANPVNSGRTDLPCVPLVSAEDVARIEIPCAGVDFRLQLPVIDSTDCETWIQVQNVGDAPVIPMLVVWGQRGSCPPQAAGPLKSECGGLLRPGSAWSFARDQVPVGGRSAVVYSLSAERIEVQPGTEIPFGAQMCDEFFFGAIGDYLDWVRFDAAYRNRGTYRGLDMGRYRGEPLAVSVNRSCPDPTDPAVTVNASYVGISSDLEGAPDPRDGGHGYYAPLVFAGSGGLNSQLHIQNSGVLCTSLEIWFYAKDNCLRPTLGDVLSLAPGESISFDPNTVVGPDWLGGAWIRATQPMGIVIDTLGPNHFTSYNGYPADVHSIDFTFGNQINYLPLTYSEYQGWDTAIQVQNLSGVTAAKVKVYFLDRSGGIITTLVDWICPRGSQTFFLPVIAGLPGGWVGSARVESQEWFSAGGPLVDPPRILSVALLEKWSDPARTTRLEAVAYNGQTECLLYDWQLGSNAGGKASGSAVFAVPLVAKGYNGVTSEIAITNLVPKPGFTDFVIYMYDQNGRIDEVCQKLSEKQVEYIDLDTWGWIPQRYLGSMVVSAIFWEHPVFDGRGEFVRNLVGLGAVSVERVGATRSGGDVPGDESKAFEAFPVFDHFGVEEPPNCPGVGRMRSQTTEAR